MLKSVADNLGTAMRDLDASDLISGDFLLISGDVISNMDLEPALTKHRARREKDKNAIMTMVLREAGVGHRTKSKGSRPVFVVDPVAERCIYYDEMGTRRGRSRCVTLDPEVLTESGEIHVRDDLIDCRIDICTQDVLAAWSDNFDFTSLRKSFLRGVLKDYETYGKTIHTYVVADQYAARVKSVRAYNAIAKDIRSRWTYPLCPDSNLVSGQCYRLTGGSNYFEDRVILARTATVKQSVIGNSTSIGDGSRITGSTVGRGCKIGKNVIIDQAYIWDDVSIEDDADIRQCIIADGSVIAKRCTIKPGALISYKVHIPEASNIPPGGTITRDHDSYKLQDSDDQDSDASSVASTHLVYQNSSASSSVSSISTLASSDADLINAQDTSRRSSFRSDQSDEKGETRDFHLEATGSIYDGLQNGDPPDTIMLELSGYRMSTNASQHEVRRALVTALVRRISSLVNSDSGSGKPIGAGEAVRLLFSDYRTLIERTMFDRDAALKGDQVDFLMLVQKEVSGRPIGDKILLFVAKESSDLDIVEVDGVLQWWEDERSKEGEMGKVRALTETLIKFLQEEDDEESDEEETSDEDEEDQD